MSIISSKNPASQVVSVVGIERVSTSSTATLKNVRGIMAGGTAGTVNITMIDDSQADGVFLQPGIPYPFAVKAFRANSAGDALSAVFILR